MSAAVGVSNCVEYLTGCSLKPGETLFRDFAMPLWNFAFCRRGRISRIPPSASGSDNPHS
ncbi:hypothetical protein F5X97DRAFT_312337 [Nemania serpens]|nr:hypothetical protein F5X97DRAFT_312337 [Nemania serpens]